MSPLAGRVATASAVLLLAALLLRALPGHAAPPIAPGALGERTRGEQVVSALDAPDPIPSSPTGPSAVEPTEALSVAGLRRPAASPPAHDDMPSPTPDIAGVLLDHLDRPLSGAVVRLEQRFPAISTRSGIGYVSFHIDPHDAVQQVSDARGEFLFTGHQVQPGHHLLYGREWVLGKGFDKVLEEGETWHELRLPDLASLTGTVRVVVLTQDSNPVDIEAVEVDPIGDEQGHVRPKPGIFPPLIGHDGAELRLGVGHWRLFVTARFGNARSVQVTVPEPGAVVERQVPLFAWPGATTEVVDADAGLVDLPPIDASRGLAQRLAGVERVGYRAELWDRHFAHSIHLGQGPVKAATLVLRLRSISGMSTNDGLNLEYLGERYAWGSLIKDLPGVYEWRHGESATVYLDLARLPGRKGAGTVDLRPYLEDGVLDVVIQDDTAVLDLDLRVVR